MAWTPRLKEILNPPPPISAREKPKNLPKLEDIEIPKRIDRSPTDVLKVNLNLLLFFLRKIDVNFFL